MTQGFSPWPLGANPGFTTDELSLSEFSTYNDSED